MARSVSAKTRETRKENLKKTISKQVGKVIKRGRTGEGAGVETEPAGEAAESRKDRILKGVKAAAGTYLKGGRRELIQTLIRVAMEKLEKDPGKTTVADLIRLLSLEKELGEEKPSKIVVEWIDPRTGKPWEPRK